MVVVELMRFLLGCCLQNRIWECVGLASVLISEKPRANAEQLPIIINEISASKQSSSRRNKSISKCTNTETHIPPSTYVYILLSAMLSRAQTPHLPPPLKRRERETDRERKGEEPWGRKNEPVSDYLELEGAVSGGLEKLLLCLAIWFFACLHKYVFSNEMHS